MDREVIYLLPMGTVDDRLLEGITDAVERTFGFPVSRLSPITIPRYAYDSARGQYHSTTILRDLVSFVPLDALRLLAITDVDLFVERLNYVFGEAAVDGRVSIISLYRLRPELYGRPPDDGLLTERAVKEAIHELGHTFGLRHCRDPRDVMYFSASITDTDRKSVGFRGECAEKMRRKLQALKAA